MLPAAVAAAVAATLAVDLSVLAGGGLDPARRADRVPIGLVSVAQGLARPAGPQVAPLRERRVPHLLAAGAGTLPAAAIERIRRTEGVASVEVVDAARAQVGGRRVGLLGVDPSTFRAYAPKSSAESDRLWQTVAAGELAVSFEVGRGGLALGGTVPAGGTRHPGQVRVGAYAALGIPEVDAVVSRTQAQVLGLPFGNAVIVSSRSTRAKALDKLARAVRRALPRGTRVTELAVRPLVQRTPRQPRQPARPVYRPDGAGGRGTPVTGNSMTPRMRAVLLEINNRFGPFPVIGCLRPGDPLDHGTGNACDFMEGTGGRMPSASALAHGDQVARYAIGNADRLGIKYVIWKQHIWNPGVSRSWRLMEDRGSLTQNHFDHVHISVR